MKRVLLYKNEITLLCSPYLKNGYICKSVVSHFKDVYNCNFYENDLDVLRARVEWLQRHGIEGEPAAFMEYDFSKKF